MRNLGIQLLAGLGVIALAIAYIRAFHSDHESFPRPAKQAQRTEHESLSTPGSLIGKWWDEQATGNDRTATWFFPDGTARIELVSHQSREGAYQVIDDQIELYLRENDNSFMFDRCSYTVNADQLTLRCRMGDFRLRRMKDTDGDTLRGGGRWRPDEEDIEASRFAESYWNKKLLKCGESYYAGWHDPSGQVWFNEYSGLQLILTREDLSDADRLNGFAWKGETKFSAAADREIAGNSTGTAGPWKDVQSFPCIMPLAKKNGAWSIGRCGGLEIDPDRDPTSPFNLYGGGPILDDKPGCAQFANGPK